jgi:hypothetical protein
VRIYPIPNLLCRYEDPVVKVELPVVPESSAANEPEVYGLEAKEEPVVADKSDPLLIG